jgi:hypothetical protein
MRMLTAVQKPAHATILSKSLQWPCAFKMLNPLIVTNTSIWLHIIPQEYAAKEIQPH